MSYWLMKSEPDEFSIDDLKERRSGESWEGIRNYQARNFIRDDMCKGDLAFFYHSSCKVPGIAGIMQINGNARPDPSAFDKDSPYFDPHSRPDQPRWYLVDVKFRKKYKCIIPLDELKRHKALRNMQLLKKGNRLSIMPVSPQEWEYINDLA